MQKKRGKMNNDHVTTDAMNPDGDNSLNEITASQARNMEVENRHERSTGEVTGPIRIFAFYVGGSFYMSIERIVSIINIRKDIMFQYMCQVTNDMALLA
ncbi:hypothetical protein ACJMK2_036760 [Sinanodonta woodiana]|uniref:Uncharacterized protein n=1 Tax=Sinanodonta woodiana TaxID=1069815 RepID=A0ABD3WI70_SINWO